VAPHSAEGKQDEFVLLLRLIERFLSPSSPLNQVRLVGTRREAELRCGSSMIEQEDTTKHGQGDAFHAIMIPHFRARKQRVLELFGSNAHQKKSETFYHNDTKRPRSRIKLLSPILDIGSNT
jgi:hypothetical protein